MGATDCKANATFAQRSVGRLLRGFLLSDGAIASVRVRERPKLLDYCGRKWSAHAVSSGSPRSGASVPHGLRAPRTCRGRPSSTAWIFFARRRHAVVGARMVRRAAQLRARSAAQAAAPRGAAPHLEMRGHLVFRTERLMRVERLAPLATTGALRLRARTRPARLAARFRREEHAGSHVPGNTHPPEGLRRVAVDHEARIDSGGGQREGPCSHASAAERGVDPRAPARRFL